MGLFSFLFGGKKAAKKKAGAAEATPVAVERAVAGVAPVAVAPTAVSAGMMQARLRLKLAASLRTGQHDAAYAAAKELADIQMRAGRKNIARVWQQQADRIKAGMPA